MTSRRIVVFDLDGTLVDTAPDLINALNFILAREGLAPVPLHAARNMIGAGARKLLERGLELEGRTVSLAELDRLTDDFINHYAEHTVDALPSRSTGSRPRWMISKVVAIALRFAPTSWNGCPSASWTG